MRAYSRSEDAPPPTCSIDSWEGTHEFNSLCEKLASEEGVSVASARLMLRMLLKAGIIRRKFRGWYELAPPLALCIEHHQERAMPRPRSPYEQLTYTETYVRGEGTRSWSNRFSHTLQLALPCATWGSVVNLPLVHLHQLERNDVAVCLIQSKLGHSSLSTTSKYLQMLVSADNPFAAAAGIS